MAIEISGIHFASHGGLRRVEMELLLVANHRTSLGVLSSPPLPATGRAVSAPAARGTARCASLFTVPPLLGRVARALIPES